MHNPSDNVAHLPTRLNVDEAWSAYQNLAIAAANDARLRGDRDYCEMMLRAWKRWSELFLATDIAA